MEHVLRPFLTLFFSALFVLLLLLSIGYSQAVDVVPWEIFAATSAKSSTAREIPRHHISGVSVGTRISGAVGQFFFFLSFT
jgi:hypothetical protein